MLHSGPAFQRVPSLSLALDLDKLAVLPDIRSRTVVCRCALSSQDSHRICVNYVILMRHIIYMNESCHACEFIISLSRMGALG